MTSLWGALQMCMQEYIDTDYARRVNKTVMDMMYSNCNADAKAYPQLEDACKKVRITVRFTHKLGAANGPTLRVTGRSSSENRRAREGRKAKVQTCKKKSDEATIGLSCYEDMPSDAVMVDGFPGLQPTIAKPTRPGDVCRLLPYAVRRPRLRREARPNHHTCLLCSMARGSERDEGAWTVAIRTVLRTLTQIMEFEQELSITDRTESAIAVIEKNLSAVQHFVCSRHQGATVSSGTGKGTAAMYKRAVLAPNQQRLERAKLNLDSYHYEG